MKVNDTIAAIATANLPSGVGIIRVSGKDSISAVNALFRPSSNKIPWPQTESHRMVHGWLVHENELLDEVLVVIMRSPRSFTTEDVVEIHCHGSLLVLQTVLQDLLKQGVRMAEPGEFTRRAFYHGRLDLTRVEAVSDLINARSQLSLKAAVNQLRGKLFEAIQGIQQDLQYVAALVEALIDFPEEDEDFTHSADCLRRLGKIEADLLQLLQNARVGKLMRNGLAVALVGKPNVGKSSLLNRLLRENRAIVTDQPGTTRDIIEETIQIQGLAFRLIDTAGIRQTDNPIEQEGIQRSRKALEQADMVMLILDGSNPLSEEDHTLIQQVDPAKTMVVWNKADLFERPSETNHPTLATWPQVWVSAKAGHGFEALQQTLMHQAHLEERPQEDTLITNLRQESCVANTLECVRNAMQGIEQQLGEECVSVDLRASLRALGEVVGETTTDDLLNTIFSSFCIGK